MGWEQTTVIPIYPEPCPPRSNEGPQQAGAFSSRSLVFTPVGGEVVGSCSGVYPPVAGNLSSIDPPIVNCFETGRSVKNALC